MGIDVPECWVTPSTTFLAKTYDPNSTIIRDSCKIDIYERNVQVSNMRSIDAPILIDILRRTIPEGVELSVHKHASSLALNGRRLSYWHSLQPSQSYRSACPPSPP